MTMNITCFYNFGEGEEDRGLGGLKEFGCICLTLCFVSIGTEECERTIAKSAVMTSKKSWERKLEATLGSNYVLLRSHTLQAIHLAVYLHKSLIPMASHAESGAVATGNTLHKCILQLVCSAYPSKS